MKLTESEWQIMNALWQGHPATAREVAERLPNEVSWAYTTIKTMLTRLAAKNAVSEEKRWLLKHLPYYARWYRFLLFWPGSDGLLPSLRVDPDWPRVVSLDWKDDRAGPAYYTVRVEQIDGIFAWSSPVWFRDRAPEYEIPGRVVTLE